MLNEIKYILPSSLFHLPSYSSFNPSPLLILKPCQIKENQMYSYKIVNKRRHIPTQLWVCFTGIKRANISIQILILVKSLWLKLDLGWLYVLGGAELILGIDGLCTITDFDERFYLVNGIRSGWRWLLCLYVIVFLITLAVWELYGVFFVIRWYVVDMNI